MCVLFAQMVRVVTTEVLRPLLLRQLVMLDITVMMETQRLVQLGLSAAQVTIKTLFRHTHVEILQMEVLQESILIFDTNLSACGVPRDTIALHLIMLLFHAPQVIIVEEKSSIQVRLITPIIFLMVLVTQALMLNHAVLDPGPQLKELMPLTGAGTVKKATNAN